MRPDDPDIALKAGLSFMKLGKTEDAFNCYRRTLEIDQEYGNLWIKNGIDATSFIKPRTPASVESVSKRDPKETTDDKLTDSAVKEPVPSSPAESEMKKPEKKTDTQRPIDKDLYNPEYLYRKGMSFTKHGYYDAAIKCFDGAVNLEPDNPVYIFSLGLVYGKTGNYESAINCFVKVLQIEPGHQGAIKGKNMAIRCLYG